ncbi:MAG TPA: hypothetical protein VN044_01990 [Verrucomicrobiae bacterium]|nr:hypothetical protein [Verrucomicrobiae bacterium]
MVEERALSGNGWARHWERTTTEYLKAQLCLGLHPTRKADFLHTTHGKFHSHALLDRPER